MREFDSGLLGVTAPAQLGDVAMRLAAIELSMSLMRDLLHDLSPAALEVQRRNARLAYQQTRLTPGLTDENAALLLRFAAIRLWIFETPIERQRLKSGQSDGSDLG